MLKGYRCIGDCKANGEDNADQGLKLTEEEGTFWSKASSWDYQGVKGKVP